jgi:hypothetical protein
MSDLLRSNFPCSISGKCQGILQSPIQLDQTWSRQDPELSEQNPPLDRCELVALDYGDSLQAGISPIGCFRVNDQIGGKDLTWHDGGDESEDYVISRAVSPGDDNRWANLRSL